MAMVLHADVSEIVNRRAGAFEKFLCLQSEVDRRHTDAALDRPIVDPGAGDEAFRTFLNPEKKSRLGPTRLDDLRGHPDRARARRTGGLDVEDWDTRTPEAFE